MVPQNPHGDSLCGYCLTLYSFSYCQKHLGGFPDRSHSLQIEGQGSMDIAGVELVLFSGARLGEVNGLINIGSHGPTLTYLFC